MEDLKTLHDQALGAAGQARKAVENNAMVLQQKLAERTQLLSQLEQAKMQETVAKSLESMSSLAAPGNTPSLDEVRDKIERRYANAMGRAELASNSVEGRMLEVQKSTLDMAGPSRLEQIRASMAGEQLGGAARAPGGGLRPAEQRAPATPADRPGQRGPARRDPGQHEGQEARRHHRRRLTSLRESHVVDERTRYFRRLRRLRRSARRWSVVGGGLAGAAAVLTPYAGIGLPDAAWAAAAGGSLALAWWRWADHRAPGRAPGPRRPDPTRPPSAPRPPGRRHRVGSRPGARRSPRCAANATATALRGTAAAAAWDRLDRASATLRGLGDRLDRPRRRRVLEAAVAEQSLRDLASGSPAWSGRSALAPRRRPAAA